MKAITRGMMFFTAMALSAHGFAQTTKNDHRGSSITNGYDCLYQAGLANAFISGLYRGIATVHDLKKHGNFGLGAPDMLDGELVMNNAKMFQTTAAGVTKPVADTATTSLFLETFFKADTSFRSASTLTKEKALQWLDAVCNNNNGLYAIRVSGEFSYIKTRAFPPLQQEPFPPLASIMDKQHFFEFQKVKGVLIGYKLPAYLDGTSIGGYHFHFLSDRQDGGGHIIDFTCAQVTVEVDVLHNLIIDIPQTADYRQVNLKQNRQDDLRKVETGKN